MNWLQRDLLTIYSFPAKIKLNLPFDTKTLWQAKFEFDDSQIDDLSISPPYLQKVLYNLDRKIIELVKSMILQLL